VARTLSYVTFYDKELRHELHKPNTKPIGEIMKIMTPNSVKIGLTTLGGFFITKASMLIAPMFLPLSDIASFGITKQMTDLISVIGGLWFSTYYPQIIQYRISENVLGIKRLYLKSNLCMIAVFIVGGLGLLIIGEPMMTFIHSKTHLLNQGSISVLLFFALLDVNASLSMSSLLTKNEVPFVKSLLLTGALTFILLLVFLKTGLGTLGMILAPAISQSLYLNWKWPITVIHELKINTDDYWKILKGIKHDLRT